MNVEQPKPIAEDVTLVIPSWNHGTFVPMALDSVLAGSIVPKEIIVVDDNSTDNTAEVLKKYLIVYVKNDIRLGVCKSLNKGFSLVSTKFGVCLGADDMWEEDYLQRCLEVIVEGKDDSIGIYYTEAMHVDVVGERTQILSSTTQEYVPGAIQNYNYVHAGAIILMDAFRKAGGFPEVELFEDWELWRAIENRGYCFKKVNGTHYLYRLHDQGHRNHSTDSKRDRDWLGQQVNFQLV